MKYVLIRWPPSVYYNGTISMAQYVARSSNMETDGLGWPLPNCSFIVLLRTPQMDRLDRGLTILTPIKT